MISTIQMVSAISTVSRSRFIPELFQLRATRAARSHGSADNVVMCAADVDPDPRRALPRVDAVLAHPAVAGRAAELGRGPATAAVRAALAAARAGVEAGQPAPGLDDVAALAVAGLDRSRAARTRAVVNATGVVLHTNLGRAPLSDAARAAVLEAAGYATVEYDLTSGTRSRRGAGAEALLREATGARGALVVNNAAGALLLALGALARGREVLVSRGELIEIGGEFRLPEVMTAAGAVLVEVGATNRTHLRDYERAVTDRTALVLAVHPSNYRVTGFTAAPALADLAALAAEWGLPLVHDVGSGLLTGTLGDEPAVVSSLAAGAGLVVFSGDKLLGGPQAGCVVGDPELVGRLARDPLARAVRADKLTLAALEATLAAHVAGRRGELPVWRALDTTPEELWTRADAVARVLRGRLGRAAVDVAEGRSVAGGGSLPGEGLPSSLVVVEPGPAGADAVLTRLRVGDPPIVARIERDRVVVDLRTVPPDLDELVAEAVAGAVEAG
jgi:L-seryl-tRNA(Ser) seleniumtransferase